MAYIEVFCRCNNHLLFELCRSMIPQHITVTKCMGFDGWEQSHMYLQHIIENGEHWAVNVDIDCFIYSWKTIEALVVEMEMEKITHFGFHDGGQIWHRNYSWMTMNPCFNIFDCRTIRYLLNKNVASWEDVHGTGPDLMKEMVLPSYLKPYQQEQVPEPFAGLFHWLFQNGKPLWDDSVMTFKELMADIDRTNPRYKYWPRLSQMNEMAQDDYAIHSCCYIHTWFARDFEWDPKQKKRIRDFFEIALDMKKMME